MKRFSFQKCLSIFLNSEKSNKGRERSSVLGKKCEKKEPKVKGPLSVSLMLFISVTSSLYCISFHRDQSIFYSQTQKDVLIK